MQMSVRRVGVTDKFDLQGFEIGSGAVFEGQGQALLAPGQIEVGVAESVQIGASSQVLSSGESLLFAGMVDEHNGGLMAALHVS